MTTRKPYQDRTDIERIESQWHKLSGLHSREEWSAAIVRAATAAEIAANLVIRKEFAERSQFDAGFVDSLLKWANGLSGKIDRLLIPLFEGRPEQASIVNLKSIATKLNRERNAIVHGGIFNNEDEAKAAIAHAKEFVETLVCLHDPSFQLKEREG